MRIPSLLVTSSLLLVVLGGAIRAAEAQTIADQPGATLLLPYFEVDLSHPAGTTTLFTVNNASATAVLGHVTVWSDLGYPVLAFNIYLTGYDMQTVDMRSILNGVLPRTASDGQDPSDTISRQGSISQDINFASCTGILPPPAALSAQMISHIQNSLTGNPSAVMGAQCLGLKYPGPDLVARGYVTVDPVNNCTLRFPSSVGYFVAGGTGDATNQNVLWGDSYLVNRNGTVGAGEPLVHIRAASTDPQTSVAGEYTFYGRNVFYTAADNREALGSSFAARYVTGGAGGFDDGTYLTVWRDPKVLSGSGFNCAVKPSWYPLHQEALIAFDEQENPTNLVASDPFGAATQRVKVGSSALPVPSSSGWLYLGLSTNVAPAGANPPEDPSAAQAWVSVNMQAAGRYSVGLPAIMLDSAMDANHAHPPAP